MKGGDLDAYLPHWKQNIMIYHQFNWIMPYTSNLYNHAVDNIPKYIQWLCWSCDIYKLSDRLSSKTVDLIEETNFLKKSTKENVVR